MLPGPDWGGALVDVEAGAGVGEGEGGGWVVVVARGQRGGGREEGQGRVGGWPSY